MTPSNNISMADLSHSRFIVSSTTLNDETTVLVFGVLLSLRRAPSYNTRLSDHNVEFKLNSNRHI